MAHVDGTGDPTRSGLWARGTGPRARDDAQRLEERRAAPPAAAQPWRRPASPQQRARVPTAQRASRASMAAAWVDDARRPSRRRSTTPRRAPSDSECPICLERLGTADIWVCLRCHGQCHAACMRQATIAHDLATNARGGFVRCFQCRADRCSILAELTAPRPAPFGARCYMCTVTIPRGTPMLRCLNRSSDCMAVWHVACRPQSTPVRCPACGCTARDCLRNRRRLA